MKSIKKITLTILVVALALISAFSLFACNEQDGEDEVRDLYIYGIEFEGDETPQSPSGEAVISDDSSGNTGESNEKNGGEQPSNKVAIIYVTFSKTDRKPDSSWIRSTTVWRCSASARENGCWTALPIWELLP